MKHIIIERSDNDAWQLFLDNILMSSFNKINIKEMLQYVLAYSKKLEYPETLPLVCTQKLHSPFDEDWLNRLEKMTKKEIIEHLRTIKIKENDTKRI